LKQFGLSSSERIKSKKEFELVFTKGEVFFSSSNRLKAAFYLVKNPGSNGIKAAFTVSKKSGNAVWRNRVKRLLRELYRLNKSQIKSVCSQKGLKLFVILSPGTLNQLNNKKIYLKDIEGDVVDLLNQIRSKL